MEVAGSYGAMPFASCRTLQLSTLLLFRELVATACLLVSWRSTTARRHQIKHVKVKYLKCFCLCQFWVYIYIYAYILACHIYNTCVCVTSRLQGEWPHPSKLTLDNYFAHIAFCTESRGTGADLPIQSNEARAFWWMSGLIRSNYV